ncbi:MAG: hypothetical protein J5958_08075 [Clostridia bacterium]|nr:hypothetical protein [Clostridia bacterium]
MIFFEISLINNAVFLCKIQIVQSERYKSDHENGAKEKRQTKHPPSHEELKSKEFHTSDNSAPDQGKHEQAKCEPHFHPVFQKLRVNVRTFVCFGATEDQVMYKWDHCDKEEHDGHRKHDLSSSYRLS